MSQHCRRNFLRRADRRAFFQARRQGERYCSACAEYRAPHQFTGEPRTCDRCRGLRHCTRCREDQPASEFGDPGALSASDDTCHTCRSYRPLTAHERATFDTFLAAEHDNVAMGDAGVTLGRDHSGRRVHLPPTLRNRHVYVLGNADTGPTTLLKNLIIQDMAAGHGCAVVDLDGGLAMDVLGSVPPHRLPVVTYFAPATGHGPTFNPLALPYPPQVIVEDMLGVFKMFLRDDWEPHVEQLLRFGLLTLLGDRTAHTLADLYTFYVAPTYRAALAEASPSPRLRAFWQHEFHSLNPDSMQRIAGMLATFLTPLSPLERLLSTAQNGLDFAALMDGRQIFIANLDKEALGPEPARLLGALLIRAAARTARGHGDRSDFYLYLPEFQDLATADFDALLSDFASHRLNLTFAHPCLGGLPKGLADALLSRVGTIAAFQVSMEDAGRLHGEMRTRCLARTSTGELYDHDIVRRAAADPIRARMRALLANPRVFADEDQPNYPGAHIDKLLADVERVRTLPLPSDLIEIDWPRTTDFTNRKPFTALVRIGRPEEVTAIVLEPSPLPDADARAKILDRPHRREQLARGPFVGKSGGGVPARSRPNPPRRKRWRRAIRTLRRPSR